MKVSLRSFLKRHWLTIIVVLVGYAIANHFYKKSITKAEPIFLIDPVRTKIIESKHIRETSLRLVRPNGNEVKGNVTSVRFYFWNNGRKSIKKSNILEPLVITLDDPNGEILDYKILKCSRKVVKPVVSLNSVDPNKNLSLSFAILEQDDGLTGQVIYKGNPEATLEIDGVVEGVLKVLTNASIIQRSWPKEIAKEFGIPFLAFLVGGFLIFWLRMKLKERDKLTKSEPAKQDKIPLLMRFILILFIILALLVIIRRGKVIIKRTQEKVLISVIQEVPKDIIP